MKKLNILKITIFAMLLYLFNMNVAYAAQLNVTINPSTSKAVVGNTVTYNVTLQSGVNLGGINYKFQYDTSKLELISGNLNDAYFNFTGKENKLNLTFKFKAKQAGTANVSLIINEAIDWDNGAPLSYNQTTSKSINIITQTQNKVSYSSNNKLSSLNVEGYNIGFNGNTEYNLSVENDVRKVNITGAKEDNTASVSGLGEHQLNEGNNKILIEVTAQNGSKKTYTINIEVKELKEIIVKVDDNEYKVVRKKEQLTKPNDFFEETTVKIDEEEVPAFINKQTNKTLIGLKNDKDEINLYELQDNTYTLYKEYKFKNVIIIEANRPIDMEGYKEEKININGNEIKAYKQNENNNFYLIYGTNVENGETNLYQYDKHEETLQIFNSSLLNKVNDLNNQNNYYIYIIIALAVILLITYIVLLIKKIKPKKEY